MKYADNGIIDVPDILFLCQMSDMEMELATLLALECMHAKGKNSIIYFPFIYNLYNIYYIYYIHILYIWVDQEYIVHHLFSLIRWQVVKVK